ncbi:hypothetical protein ACTFIW_000737 [Dictyostelium discoideum]
MFRKFIPMINQNEYRITIIQYKSIPLVKKDDDDDNNDEDENNDNSNRIKQISSGYSHTLILNENGEYLSIGQGEFGQLGIPLDHSSIDKDSFVNYPTVIPALLPYLLNLNLRDDHLTNSKKLKEKQKQKQHTNLEKFRNDKKNEEPSPDAIITTNDGFEKSFFLLQKDYISSKSNDLNCNLSSLEEGGGSGSGGGSGGGSRNEENDNSHQELFPRIDIHDLINDQQKVILDGFFRTWCS